MRLPRHVTARHETAGVIKPTLATMDFALPAEDDPRRMSLRRWLETHPRPTARQLAEQGLVAPHWPPPWGLGADPTHQLIVDDELRRAGVRRPENTIGIGWAGPTILHAGSDEQIGRYLLPLLAGEEIWCQLFSEPGAGSDLASLTTRAELDGDQWVVQGQKVWTSYAHAAQFGILLARTEPEAPKHEGISYFICPMDAPGLSVRPLVDMTGTHTFNEVTLDDVRLDAGSLVGERGRGWSLAKVTLGNDRVRRSEEPVAPLMRQRLAALWVEGEILRLLRLRTVSAAVAGQEPGPEASVRKALADDHGVHIMQLANDLAGARGMIYGATPVVGTEPDGDRVVDPIWSFGLLFSPALTIGGGTAEVQRNIVAERTLGLPHDPPA
jgi:alkylation response protein AidB-like acyl-CoA dehydrogenase